MTSLLTHHSFLFACAAPLILLTAGCATPAIPISVSVPGEYNVSGVSKIALGDFNTLADDRLTGIHSADPETISIVKRMVSSAFAENGVFQVADLDIEKEIASDAGRNVAPSSRFDAVLTARVWWQKSPEYRVTYPKVFNLEAWRFIRYDTGNKDQNGRPIYSTARVTQETRDVLETLSYRAENATLMLSLSLYRVDGKGRLEKIADTFAAASDRYLLDNGLFRVQFEQHAATPGDAQPLLYTGHAMPTELQCKLILGRALAANAVHRFSPHKTQFFAEPDFGDEVLPILLRNGAYDAAGGYAVAKIWSNVGVQTAKRIPPAACYDMPPYCVSASDPEEITPDSVRKAALDNEQYLYALALAEEGRGDSDQSLETYRYLFGLRADAKYAAGISRCLFALNMKDRVNETVRAARDAGKKASLK